MAERLLIAVLNVGHNLSAERLRGSGLILVLITITPSSVDAGLP